MSQLSTADFLLSTADEVVDISLLTHDIWICCIIGSQLRVDCNFELPYLCGYVTSTLGQLTWSRTKGSDPSQVTGPSADSNNSPNGKLAVIMLSIQHTANKRTLLIKHWLTSSQNTNSKGKIAFIKGFICW
jgi:MAM domain, meprin/A5/mu